MAKNDFISGSILEFKIPCGLGFGYCKIVDFRSIREFDGVLAKVYDCFVTEPLKDISILDSKEWLFGARRLAGLPNTRGKGAWKFKGVLISPDDNIIPDFKYSQKFSALMDDESALKEWYAIINLTESNDKTCSYEAVKHLENTAVGTQYGIEIRTAMEYYRCHDLDIAKDFDLNELINSNIYRMMMNVPIYKTIPPNIRGRAL